MESLSKLEKRPEELVTVKNTLIHIEQFMESVNKENIELQQINKGNTARISKIEAENNHLKVQMAEIELENKNNREHMLKVDTQSCRDNLVLDGIPETPAMNKL